MARQGSLRNFYRETLVVQVHSARSDEIKTGVKRKIFLNIFLLSITEWRLVKALRRLAEFKRSKIFQNEAEPALVIQSSSSFNNHLGSDIKMPFKVGGLENLA